MNTVSNKSDSVLFFYAFNSTYKDKKILSKTLNDTGKPIAKDRSNGGIGLQAEGDSLHKWSLNTGNTI